MLQRSNREFNQTVLMITHNPDAASIADRILTMRDGEIVNVERGEGALTRAAHASVAKRSSPQA